MGGDVPCDVERCCQASPRKEERMAERSIAAPDSAEVARLRRGFLGQLMLRDEDGYHRL
jgi:hypothetical protein